jgi:hypothetical protein
MTQEPLNFHGMFALLQLIYPPHPFLFIAFLPDLRLSVVIGRLRSLPFGVCR